MQFCFNRFLSWHWCIRVFESSHRQHFWKDGAYTEPEIMPLTARRHGRATTYPGVCRWETFPNKFTCIFNSTKEISKTTETFIQMLVAAVGSFSHRVTRPPEQSIWPGDLRWPHRRARTMRLRVARAECLPSLPPGPRLKLGHGDLQALRWPSSCVLNALGRNGSRVHAEESPKGHWGFGDALLVPQRPWRACPLPSWVRGPRFQFSLPARLGLTLQLWHEEGRDIPKPIFW